MKKKGTLSRSSMSVIIITSLVILIALVLLSGFYTHKLLRDDSDRLVKSIDEIIESSGSGDWERSSETIRRMSSDWGKMKGIWSSLIDHQEIDNIDITLSRLQMLIEIKDTSALMPEAAALRKIISHIPEKEKLTLDNLL